MSSRSESRAPGLSTSQLDSSFRRSQSLSNSVNNGTAQRQQETMHQTQRLLKVLQSHPITRPESHLPYPHLPSSSAFAASSSTGRFSPPPSSRDGFDVLDGFRRELERVRRDVNAWSHSERVIEQRQSQRMADLGASAPYSRDLESSGLSRTIGAPPSASLMNSISSLIHSPSKLSSSRHHSNAFSLAPSHVPSPFASFNGSPRASPSDPHVQGLAAKGSLLLDSQSTALDASHSALQSVLAGLHTWKESRGTELRHTLANIEAKLAQQTRDLIERFEADRAKLEASARAAADDARRNHARAVELHVEELNRAVEREFKSTGGISSSFHAPAASTSTSFSHSKGVASQHLSDARFHSLDRSMRLEHLDGGDSKHAEDSSDEEQAGVRAAARRKRMQYSSALHGSATRSLSQSQPLSGKSTAATAALPPRQTVASLLYSSDDDAEDDSEALRKNELIAQANFLKHVRHKHRGNGTATVTPVVDLAHGISGRSRGRGTSESKRARLAESRAKSEARVLLESSSSDPSGDEREDPYQKARLANSVRFAPSPAPGPQASPIRRPRTEKSAAAAVFVSSSDDDDARPPTSLAGVDRNSVHTAAAASIAVGRLHSTPAKAQPGSLSAMARTFSERVSHLQQAAKHSR